MRQRVLHPPGDVVESDPPLQKQAHRRLVGAVEHRAGRAACGGGLSGQTQTGKRRLVRLRKGQRAALQQVQRPIRALRPMGILQRVADRQLHVRRAQLRQQRAVPKLHQRVDDALPVDHRAHLLHGKAVQPHGLDDLQSLVHQRGGIHRDLRPHVPVGMPQGVRRRHMLQLLVASAEKRPAGAGQPDAPHLVPVPAPLQTLEHRAVLAVHRHDLRAVLRRRGHHQLAGADQRLLVGQRDALALFDGRQRGLQPHAAHDGGDHRVRLGHGGGSQKAFLPCHDLYSGAPEPLFQLQRRIFVIQHRKARHELPRLPLQQVDLRVGGQCRHGYSLLPDHLQGLPSDGAGSAQQGNGFRHRSPLSTASRR